MLGFLAIILNMGIIELPDIESYWKTSWSCRVPFFSQILPRDRFQEIFWMLHIGTPGVTARKIDKVKPLLDLLLPTFQRLYSPTKELAIDETMVGFRGRFGSIQYMPQKPTKWGIKAFTLADGANGYLLNVLLYTGAQTLENADPAFAALPVPGRVVMDVLGPYLNRGHHAFTDRYANTNTHTHTHTHTRAHRRMYACACMCVCGVCVWHTDERHHHTHTPRRTK